MPQGAVLAIVGPTASGKSALAERVALHLGAPVVSIDAMQVYRGMDIGTAKTPPAERTVPLLMVDVCGPNEDYSAQLFQRDARCCIDGLLAQGTVPVLAGGTGLYLSSVIDRMEFPSGEKGAGRRRDYEEYLARYGADALHELLELRDPRSAALIHPHNSRRVVRALEIADEGVCYADQVKGLHAPRPYYEAQICGLAMDRGRLYGRINDRVDAMFAEGLVDEVARLREMGLTRDLTAGQAIGYKEVLAALAGECTMDEAREQVKLRTRRYAKRQISWFKRDERVRWLDLDHLSLDDCASVILSRWEAEHHAAI